MSHIYSLIFGRNPLSHLILAALNLQPRDVGRFRDCFIVGDQIVVYTRNGGGNRQHWDYGETDQAGESCNCPGCIITYHLPKHPLYIRDEDDELDCTYASIFFRMPDNLADTLKTLPGSLEKWEPDKRWREIVQTMEKPV